MYRNIWTLSAHSPCLPRHGSVVLLVYIERGCTVRERAAGVPQVSYAEDDSPQLSEDDDADGAAAEEDGGEEYMARAALGLRTKPRKVLLQDFNDHPSIITASPFKVPAFVTQDDFGVLYAALCFVTLLAWKVLNVIVLVFTQHTRESLYMLTNGGGAYAWIYGEQVHQLSMADDARPKARGQSRSGGGGGRHRIHRSVAKAWTHPCACIAVAGDQLNSGI